VPPVAALRSQDEPRGADRPSRVRVTAAAVSCATGVICAAVGVVSERRQYPLVLVALGGMLTFVGVVLLGPVLVGPVARVVGRPLGALLGVPGRLATANAVRNPGRAATTMLAMVIGITLITGVSVVTRSLTGSVDIGVAEALPADYTILPPGARDDAVMPRSVASDLRVAPGVTAVTAIGKRR
jgi:putative ABC transport system permease protein